MGRASKNKSIADSLENFQDVPPDHGLSLDQLSESFARLLGAGEIPYEESGEQGPTDPAVEKTNDPAATASKSDPTPVSPETIVEAILFVGEPTNQPISSRQIASLMRGVRAVEVEQIVEQLNAKYARHGCPYYLESVARGYRMTLRPEFHFVRDQFLGRIRHASLTQPAMTALALVAYHQPITKARISEMSSQEAARSLTQLVRRGLLSVEQRKVDQRSESWFRTTDRFLQLFGLNTLDELPRTHELDG